MRDEFEYYGQGAFSMASEHSQQNAVFHTDQMTGAALPKDTLERHAWQPTWQKHGWLCQNPLVGYVTAWLKFACLHWDFLQAQGMNVKAEWLHQNLLVGL